MVPQNHTTKVLILQVKLCSRTMTEKAYFFGRMALWHQITRIPSKPQVEQLFGRYYTEKQMQEAVITRTKKAIMKDVVEPHRKGLTPAQRDHILALLDKLTY
jgi:hypothetical protein